MVSWLGLVIAVSLPSGMSAHPARQLAGPTGQGPLQLFQSSRSERLFEKGVEHYNAGRYYSALDIFRRLMEYSPETNNRLTASYLMTMKSYFHAGRPAEAKEVGRSFMVKYSTSSYLNDVYECFGDIFVTEGRYRSALENYLKARELAQGDTVLSRLDGKLGHLAGGLLDELEIRDLLGVETDKGNRAILTLMLAQRLLATGRGDEAALTLFRADVESIPSPFMKEYTYLKKRSFESDRNVVVVGAVLPLSGYDRSYGRSFLRGMQEAVENIKNRQSVEIVLEVLDNAGEDITTVSSVKTLLANPNVVAVVGPLSTPNAVTAAAVASEAGVPILIPLSTQVGLTGIGSNIFQMNADLFRQGQYAAEYAITERGLKVLAVVAPADYFGKQLTDGFVQRADELGGEIVAVEWYTGVPTDLSKQFSSLRKVAFSLEDLKMKSGLFRLELDTSDNTFFISEEDFLPGEKEPAKSLSRFDSSRIVLKSIEGLYLPIHKGDINYVASQFSSYYLNSQLLGNSNWYDVDELSQEMIGPNIDGMVVLADYLNPGDRIPDETAPNEPVFYEGDEKRVGLFGYEITKFLAGQLGAQPGRSSLLENLRRAKSFRGMGKSFSFSDGTDRVNASQYVLVYRRGGFTPVAEFSSDSLLTHTSRSP